MTGGDWPAFVAEVGLDLSPIELRAALQSCALQLPSAADAPLPSPQLAKVWEPEIAEDHAALLPWQVDCLRLDYPIKQLSDLHFLAFFRAEGLQPGGDFLFWYWFTQELKRLLVRDQYLPALIYREPPKPKGTVVFRVVSPPVSRILFGHEGGDFSEYDPR